jgi:hypothetical protein
MIAIALDLTDYEWINIRILPGRITLLSGIFMTAGRELFLVETAGKPLCLRHGYDMTPTFLRYGCD